MITMLTGLNTYAIADALQAKTSAFEGQAEILDASELEEKNLPDIFMGASLFATKRLIIIKGAATSKSLWPLLEQWISRVPDESDIILVDQSADKRTKTYKQLQKHGAVIDHPLLNDADLLGWIQTQARSLGVDLQPDSAKYLVTYVGADQWRLRSELEKLILAKKPITRQLIQDIAEPYPEATAFELLDAVFAGNTNRVDDLLTLLRQREDPYQFLGLLSSQVFGLLAIVSAGSRRPDEIAKDMALHPFVVRKLSGSAQRLGKPRVERLVQQLAHADVRIKTTGVDPWRQLEITLGSV